MGVVVGMVVDCHVWGNGFRIIIHKTCQLSTSECYHVDQSLILYILRLLASLTPHLPPHINTAKYQVNILKKLRSINVDYHQVGWYQSTYLNSHINKEFLESHVRYQQTIEESIVLIYGEPSWCELFV